MQADPPTGPRRIPQQPSTGWLRVAFDHAPHAIELTDADCRIRYVNAAFERLTGWTQAEIVGQTPAQFLRSPRHAGGFWNEIDANIRAGKPWSGDIVSLHKDGSDIHQELSIVPIVEEGEVRWFVSMRVDVTARKALKDRLHRAATRDLLTGLFRRNVFFERVQRAVARSRRGGPGFAVLFLDVDRFKSVNDREGHAAGDDLLRRLAERLRASLRGDDTIARLGGDEFAVLLPGVEDAGLVRELAARLLALRPREAGSGPPAWALSIGTAMGPGREDSGEDVVAAADAAMYRAKRAGGDRVEHG